MEFEWDDDKANRNFIKHGIRFTEAASIWLDDSALEMLDEHSSIEERWIRLGVSKKLQILVVVYCERIESERIRLISARKATKTETAQYKWRIA